MTKGKDFWKGLAEKANSPAFRQHTEREFPENSGEGFSRRSFMNLMASSMALAGVTGCKTFRRPEGKILPYNTMPEHVVPGKPLYYATSMALGEEVTGLVVESHEGRPTKIEGNELHPASLGATSVIHQASILNLYDPDRSQAPLKQGKPSSWSDFWQAMGPVVEKHSAEAGKGLRFLSGYITSPSLAEIKNHVLSLFPKARWHTWEPVNRGNVLRGLHAATGQKVDVHYQFTAALRILSVDCDFLQRESNSLVYARAFTEKRDPDSGPMNRLYMVESDYSLTGARADHRLKLKPSGVRYALWQIADYIFNTLKVALPAGIPEEFREILRKGASRFGKNSPEEWIGVACKDLLEKPRQSLVCAGKNLPPVMHALAHVINLALGSAGRTVTYKPPASLAFNPDAGDMTGSLARLTEEMEAEKAETLIILGANPAFTAPVDLGFAKVLTKVKNTVHFGMEYNETAAACGWHLPESHYLEAWSDGAAFDGTTNIAQPLIAPLYNTLSAAEFLAKFFNYPYKSSQDIVKNYWRKRSGNKGFEKKWLRWVHDGVMKNSASFNIATGISFQSLSEECDRYLKSAQKPAENGLEVLFREDLALYDGRFANNGWLQEFPDPMTRLAWGNAAVMSLTTAEKLGVSESILLKDKSGIPLGKTYRPMVEVSLKGRSVKLPVCLLPGLSNDTILLNFGYGREKSGRIGRLAGANVYTMRTMANFEEGMGATVKKTGKKFQVANVQEHWSMKGRDIVRVENIHQPHKAHHGHGAHPSLWDEHQYKRGQQWGMVIDLNRCTGCGSCVAACQAENNVPIVGKRQVALNREMHWNRVDRYFQGKDVDNPRVVHQMITCQQCEMAPCETVCPVAATVHSSDGLNDMVYNRCVGTRYCSNNCPYKVRRYNYFNYTNRFSETEKMLQNPDVTVRFRGVMEKCTFCVQRINEQRIAAKNDGSEHVSDGKITPACAQACPTRAITFGDILDEKSRVAKLKEQKRNYELFPELNIRPRNSFLSRLWNPNPILVHHEPDKDGEGAVHRKDHG